MNWRSSIWVLQSAVFLLLPQFFVIAEAQAQANGQGVSLQLYYLETVEGTISREELAAVLELGGEMDDLGRFSNPVPVTWGDARYELSMDWDPANKIILIVTDGRITRLDYQINQ